MIFNEICLTTASYNGRAILKEWCVWIVITCNVIAQFKRIAVKDMK